MKEHTGDDRETQEYLDYCREKDEWDRQWEEENIQTPQRGAERKNMTRCPICEERDGSICRKCRDDAYLQGLKEGIKRFAWWKDGTQYVGTSGTTLKRALADVDPDR